MFETFVPRWFALAVGITVQLPVGVPGQGIEGAITSALPYLEPAPTRSEERPRQAFELRRLMHEDLASGGRAQSLCSLPATASRSSPSSIADRQPVVGVTNSLWNTSANA